MSRSWIIFVALVVMLGIGGVWLYNKGMKGDETQQIMVPLRQELKKVVSMDKLQDSYDLVVVGTDPEGISAAVSAARNGLKTLLIDSKNREILGGLMTVGWLNTIDMNWVKSSLPSNKEQAYLNQGIFTEWYEKVEGHSFDIQTAANSFYGLASSEKNIDVSMQSQAIEPIVKQRDKSIVVEGVRVTTKDGTQHSIAAKAVIDATQDGDFAAAAGVGFTIGREDLGDAKSSMAVTAIFRLNNIDAKAWELISKRLNGDGNPDTGIDKMSAWGYGAEMKRYVPLNKQRAMTRGLNIGRQNDNTILINSLHIFGINGLKAASHKEALKIASEEIPNVVKYLNTFPEFKHAKLDGIAPELYVRETRHMKGLYRLSIVDLLENRDQWDRIAFGSYPADIQKTSPADNGAIPVDPWRYAVPFRSIVPQAVDGLLVVGRSASYDTLAHGSARVIPVGMAEGQAAGVAVKLAKEHNITFRELSESKPLITEMQKQMNDQGMDIKPYTLEQPSFMKHKDYPGLKAAVYMGLAYGSYGNTRFDLDKVSNAQRLANQVSNMKRIYASNFTGNPSEALKGMKEPDKKQLSLQQASFTLVKAIGLNATLEEAQAELLAKGIISKATVDSIADKQNLTNGDAFMLLRDAVGSLAGKQF